MEILLIPAVLIAMLYMVFQSAREKRSPWVTLLFIVCFAGISAFGVLFLAAVKASYQGQKEWQQERAFFLGIFIQKLESSGDMKKSAIEMQSEEVKVQTLKVIQKIVSSFRRPAVMFLSGGGAILVFAAALLWFRKVSERRSFPWLLAVLVLLGVCLGCRGVFFWQYANGSDRQMKNFLRCQQEFLMKELSETETDLSIQEIITVIAAETKRVNGFGYGQYIPESLRRKNKTPAE